MRHIAHIAGVRNGVTETSDVLGGLVIFEELTIVIVQCSEERVLIYFKDIPTGTIFEAHGDIFIKISRIDIRSQIGFEKREGDCTSDRETLPNAVYLANGAVSCFCADDEVTTVYPSAIISIE